MKIIEKSEVFEKLPMIRCIELMREALIALEKGDAVQPLRAMYKLPQGETFGFMPAYLGKETFFGAKVVVACPQNAGTEYPSHSGYVMVFESKHGRVEGLVDAGAITQIRTGAVSAVATDVLARKDSHRLALIGAGAQARSHLEAMLLVRDIQKITVYDIRKEAAEAFKKEMEEKFRVSIEVCDSVQSAVCDADIICTLTPSKSAYLQKEWVKAGAHINAVGTFTPSSAEVQPQLVAASRLYGDYCESTRKESGEYLDALKLGLIHEDHLLGSVGEVLLNRVEGRNDDQQITMFDALGLAVEDIAAAMALCQ